MADANNVKRPCNVEGTGLLKDFAFESTKAAACILEREKETRKPHYFTMLVGSETVWRDVVIPMGECAVGATADALIGNNELVARKCAESLSRITGVPHEAMVIQKRLIFADSYQVVRVKMSNGGI